MRIGYAKLGRSMQLGPDNIGFAGNPTVRRLLDRLARRNPEHEFVLVGKNDGNLDSLPSNVSNPIWAGRPLATWTQDNTDTYGAKAKPELLAYENEVALPAIADVDAMIIHVGNHAPLSYPIPPVGKTWAECERPGERLAKPYIWARNYAGYLIRGLNMFQDRFDGQGPIVYVCEDSRNIIKARDIKWPTGTDRILSQHEFKVKRKHERYRDDRKPRDLGFRARTLDRDEVWEVEHSYSHGGLEFMTLDDSWPTWGDVPFEERAAAGVGTTSWGGAYDRTQTRRSILVRDFLLRAFPDAEVQGKWDEDSLGDMADVPDFELHEPEPSEYGQDLAKWKSTLVLPVVSSGWSTAKPWQVYAARTVAFHLVQVDEQGWMLPARRRVRPAKHVGTVHGTPLYSVRDDWTEDELFLARWTRIEKPEEFEVAAKAVAGSRELYERLTDIQHRLLVRRWEEWLTESLIEKELGLM